MRKIIVGFIALAFGGCAFAKDINTLVSEWSNITVRQDRIDYVKTNVSDIAQAYPIWLKNGCPSSQRGIFAATYWHTTVFDGVSDSEAIRLSPQKLYQIRISENANWYENLKDCGFKIDGVQLTNWQIFELARTARDRNVVEEIVLKTPLHMFLTTGFETAENILRRLKDPKLAREKLIEFENILLDRNIRDERLEKIQASLQTIRGRCLDASY